MDQIDPQNQQVFEGGNLTTNFNNLKAGRMIMAQLCAELGMRSMMMIEFAVSVATLYLEAD